VKFGTAEHLVNQAVSVVVGIFYLLLLTRLPQLIGTREA
jgi:hypothetical protein